MCNPVQSLIDQGITNKVRKAEPCMIKLITKRIRGGERFLEAISVASEVIDYWPDTLLAL